MRITRCDICGKETDQHFKAKKLKVKKEDGGYGTDIFWKDYHLCEECQENVIRAARLLKSYFGTDIFGKAQIDGWRPISEYDRMKYDWVLVKMFDGDFQCVPFVAVQRRDGRWYDRNDNEITAPFVITEFFDFSMLPKDKVIIKKGWMV